MEILLLDNRSVGAELLRRRPDGSWPDAPETVAPDGVLTLESVGLTMTLRDAYVTTVHAPVAIGDSAHDPARMLSHQP